MSKLQKIDKNQMLEMLNDAKSIIEMNYNKIEAEDGKALHGWHNFFEQKVGSTGSAIVLVYFKRTRQDFEDTENVLKSILDARKENNDKCSWAILHIPHLNTIEGTIFPMLSLVEYNSESKYNNIIFDTVSWILQTQLNNGGWNSNGNPNSPARVNLTCNVLDLLDKLKGEYNPNNFDRGINWLINSQNKDGSWGEVTGKTGNIFFTAKALKTILKSGNKISHQNVLKATNYIVSNYCKNHSFIAESYDIKFNDGYNRIVLEHDIRAEIIELYCVCPNLFSDKFIFSILADALEYYKENKFINVENSLKKQTIWTIVPIATAITKMYEKILPQAEQHWGLLFDKFIVSDMSEKVNSNLQFVFSYFIKPLKNKKIFLWSIAFLCTIAVVTLFVFQIISFKELLLSVIIPIILFLLGLKK